MKHPDCHCPRTTHNHGSRTTYIVHKCKCSPCREANRLSERARNRAKVYGRYDKFIPGDDVRTHLRRLMSQGMGWKPIARHADVATSTVYAILYGKLLDQPEHPEHRPPRLKVSRPVAEKLLAVELQLEPGAVVPNVGTARRLQALVSVGWSGAELASRIGVSRVNFGPLLHGQRAVTHATAVAVQGLFDALWDQAPPARTSKRSRNLAARYGWVPPLAWDDDIDDPNAVPNVVNELEIRRWHIEDVQWLLQAGTSPEEIATRLGVKVATMARAFQRAGIDATELENSHRAQLRKAAA